MTVRHRPTCSVNRYTFIALANAEFVPLPRERLMTIILPLEPQEEAKLIALAQEKGVTTDALVRAAINAMLAEAGNAPVLEPIHSLRGLLAKYGPAPLCVEFLRN